jgi:hypothetical protein
MRGFGLVVVLAALAAVGAAGETYWAPFVGEAVAPDDVEPAVRAVPVFVRVSDTPAPVSHEVRPAPRPRVVRRTPPATLDPSFLRRLGTWRPRVVHRAAPPRPRQAPLLKHMPPQVVAMIKKRRKLELVKQHAQRLQDKLEKLDDL